jgi:hypothetical protein
MPQNTAFHTEIPCGTEGIPNVLNGALDVLNQDYWKKILLMFRIMLKEQRAEDYTCTNNGGLNRNKEKLHNERISNYYAIYKLCLQY